MTSMNHIRDDPDYKLIDEWTSEGIGKLQIYHSKINSVYLLMKEVNPQKWGITPMEARYLEDRIKELPLEITLISPEYRILGSSNYPLLNPKESKNTLYAEFASLNLRKYIENNNNSQSSRLEDDLLSYFGFLLGIGSYMEQTLEFHRSVCLKNLLIINNQLFLMNPYISDNHFQTVLNDFLRPIIALGEDWKDEYFTNEYIRYVGATQNENIRKINSKHKSLIQQMNLACCLVLLAIGNKTNDEDYLNKDGSLNMQAISQALDNIKSKMSPFLPDLIESVLTNNMKDVPTFLEINERIQPSDREKMISAMNNNPLLSAPKSNNDFETPIEIMKKHNEPNIRSNPVDDGNYYPREFQDTPVHKTISGQIYESNQHSDDLSQQILGDKSNIKISDSTYHHKQEINSRIFSSENQNIYSPENYQKRTFEDQENERRKIDQIPEGNSTRYVNRNLQIFDENNGQYDTHNQNNQSYQNNNLFDDELRYEKSQYSHQSISAYNSREDGTFPADHLRQNDFRINEEPQNEPVFKKVTHLKTFIEENIPTDRVTYSKINDKNLDYIPQLVQKESPPIDHIDSMNYADINQRLNKQKAVIESNELVQKQPNSSRRLEKSPQRKLEITGIASLNYIPQSKKQPEILNYTLPKEEIHVERTHQVSVVPKQAPTIHRNQHEEPLRMTPEQFAELKKTGVIPANHISQEPKANIHQRPPVAPVQSDRQQPNQNVQYRSEAEVNKKRVSYNIPPQKDEYNDDQVSTDPAKRRNSHMIPSVLNNKVSDVPIILESNQIPSNSNTIKNRIPSKSLGRLPKAQEENNHSGIKSTLVPRPLVNDQRGGLLGYHDPISNHQYYPNQAINFRGDQHISNRTGDSQAVTRYRIDEHGRKIIVDDKGNPIRIIPNQDHSNSQYYGSSGQIRSDPCNRTDPNHVRISNPGYSNGGVDYSRNMQYNRIGQNNGTTNAPIVISGRGIHEQNKVSTNQGRSGYNSNSNIVTNYDNMYKNNYLESSKISSGGLNNDFNLSRSVIDPIGRNQGFNNQSSYGLQLNRSDIYSGIQPLNQEINQKFSAFNNFNPVNSSSRIGGNNLLQNNQFSSNPFEQKLGLSPFGKGDTGIGSKPFTDFNFGQNQNANLTNNLSGGNQSQNDLLSGLFNGSGIKANIESKPSGTKDVDYDLDDAVSRIIQKTFNF